MKKALLGLSGVAVVVIAVACGGSNPGTPPGVASGVYRATNVTNSPNTCTGRDGTAIDNTNFKVVGSGLNPATSQPTQVIICGGIGHCPSGKRFDSTFRVNADNSLTLLSSTGFAIDMTAATGGPPPGYPPLPSSAAWPASGFNCAIQTHDAQTGSVNADQISLHLNFDYKITRTAGSNSGCTMAFNFLSQNGYGVLDVAPTVNCEDNTTMDLVTP